MTIDRRKFLTKTSLALASVGVGQLIPLEALATIRKPISPNDRIGVGLVGCKGMGFTDLRSMLNMGNVEVIALCDVDENVLKQRTADLEKAGVKNPKWYVDHRAMLDDKDIDVVIIGTPDHWHCLQFTDAVSAGKDVYCEKPIANSIQEADIMLKTVQNSDRVVQVGQWQRSQPHMREAIEFVHSGALGDIRLVKAWAYMGWLNPIPAKPNTKAPSGVDYERWLGPATLRPFNENRFHFTFRWFWDYAGGLMTDWGVHLLDYVIYGMKRATPESVMAMGGKFAYPDDAQETPDTMQTVYDFGEYAVLWEQAMGISGGNYGNDHGIAYIGNNGTLVLHRGGWEVIPENKKMEAVPFTEQSGNGLDNHTRNFIDVVQSRETDLLNAPIQIGYDAAVMSHMGNVAYKAGEKLFWNDSRHEFTNTAANQFLKATYHNGYKLPTL